MRQGPRVSPIVAVMGAMGAGLFLVPMVGLVARAPWRNLASLLASDESLTALRLSMVTSLTATAVAAILGTPLAWLLARGGFPGRRLLRAVVLVPLVLPPVVGGVALLLAFGRRGPLGFLSLPFSTAGAALAAAFVSMPLLIITAESAFRSSDRRYEEAARVLGAHRLKVFRKVTLPACWPALVGGAVLTWARALGEFGATITFAGSTPHKTTTIPLQVYLLLESGNTDGAIALSLVLVVISIAVLATMRDRWMTAL